MKTFVVWTKFDDGRLCEMVEGAGIVRGACNDRIWSDIAKEFPGRSWMACKQRWQLLQRIAAGKLPKPHVRTRRTHQEIVAARQPPQIPPPQPLYVPLPIAVAIILGDPMPGRSALDKQRTGQLPAPKGVTLSQGVG